MVSTKKRSPSSKSGTRNMKTHERRRLRFMLWNEQHGFCALCGEAMELGEATIDHIVPVAHGGRNRRANLRVAHKHCNSARRDKAAATFVCAPVQRDTSYFGWHTENEDE